MYYMYYTVVQVYWYRYYIHECTGTGKTLLTVTVIPGKILLSYRYTYTWYMYEL